MKNAIIVKEFHSGMVVSWVVYADSDRFGQHALVAQFPFLEEAEQWCLDNGITEWGRPQKEAEDFFREEMERGWGKVQIGNAMFRRLRHEGGHYYGHSASDYGCEALLTSAMRFCRMTADGVGKTYFRDGHKTIKFGTKCTW